MKIPSQAHNFFSIKIFKKYYFLFRNKDGNRYEELEVKELVDRARTEIEEENSIISFAHVSSIFEKLNHKMLLHEVRPIIHPIVRKFV